MPMSELEKVIPRFIAMNLIQHVKSMPEPEPKAAATVHTNASAAAQPESDVVGNPWKAANVRLEISGRRQKQRALIKLNGQPKSLSNQSFEALLRLAVAMKCNGAGWVPQSEYGSSETCHKIIQRLRDGLEAPGIDTADLIENDGSKRYRLSMPPDQISLDEEAILLSFPDVEEILKPLREHFAKAS
jgi:hypothetical protein